MTRRRPLACGAVAVLAVGVLAACGSDGAACDVPRQEPPDPASGLHVLDDTGLIWDSAAPTSGPHRSVVPEGGLRDAPVDELDQVAFLEAGGVIVQMDARAVVPDEISALAGPDVLVAPGLPELPDPVVATAWTWRLRCSAVEVEPLRAFIEERVGAATGH